MTRRFGWSVILCCLIAGCGGNNFVPVSGRVTNGESSLSAGLVAFHPDASKGNESKMRHEGLIEADGTYTLYTNELLGAPAGWYKVTVSSDAAETGDATSEEDYAIPKRTIREEYTREDLTPLAVEVLAGGGSYDLKLQPVN